MKKEPDCENVEEVDDIGSDDEAISETQENVTPSFAPNPSEVDMVEISTLSGQSISVHRSLIKMVLKTKVCDIIQKAKINEK